MNKQFADISFFESLSSKSGGMLSSGTELPITNGLFSASPSVWNDNTKSKLKELKKALAILAMLVAVSGCGVQTQKALSNYVEAGKQYVEQVERGEIPAANLEEGKDYTWHIIKKIEKAKTRKERLEGSNGLVPMEQVKTIYKDKGNFRDVNELAEKYQEVSKNNPDEWTIGLEASAPKKFIREKTENSRVSSQNANNGFMEDDLVYRGEPLLEDDLVYRGEPVQNIPLSFRGFEKHLPGPAPGGKPQTRPIGTVPLGGKPQTRPIGTAPINKPTLKELFTKEWEKHNGYFK